MVDPGTVVASLFSTVLPRPNRDTVEEVTLVQADILLREASKSPYGRKRVLVVDQPKFGQMISQMISGAYSCDIVPDARSAVDALRSAIPDVIVADVDIPGGGLKLAQLLGVSPTLKAIPVVLMANGSADEFGKRAKQAGAVSFLPKPFGPESLEEILASILLTEACEGPVQIEPLVMTQVREIQGLPSLPATHAEILALTRNPGASTNAIAEMIELDPGLLATVLKLANSSCFGFRQRVDSIKLAVTLLGMEEIGDLVVSAHVFEHLGSSEKRHSLDVDAFWRHSVGTAFVARGLAKWMQIEGGSAYLAGLLHDVGKVVLDQHFGYFYGPVFKRILEDGLVAADAEADALGITHAEVGGELAIQWKLPEAIQDCMMYHHRPWHACRYDRTACLIHLADVMCHRLGYGLGTSPRLDETVIERFNLGGKFLTSLLKAAKVDLERADAFLSDLKH